MVKHLGWRKLALALVIVLVCGALGLRAYKEEKSAPAGPPTVGVTRGDLEQHFVDSGELDPKLYVDVASQVSGRVIELDVEEGRRVRKGQKLCVIQPGRTGSEGYVPLPLTAPMAGIVMRYQDRDANYSKEGRLAKLGDYVTGLIESNQPTYLMTIADLSRLIVRMKISEMDVLELKEGMGVTVTVDALPGESFPGKITLISPQAEKDQNNLEFFRVEVSLLRVDPRLKPGMTARVDGLLASRKQVLKLPLSAVFEEGGKDYAYVSRPPEKPRKALLKLGLRSEMEAEVLSGVELGDRLLTDKPGAPQS